MSTTLTEAQRIVRRAARCGADDGRFTTDDINDAINAIGNDFVNRTRCVRQSSTAIITADTEAVVLNITGFEWTRVRSIYVTKDSNYSYADIRNGVDIISPTDMLAKLGRNTSSGTPRYIAFDSATAAKVYPLPSHTGTITIRWAPFFSTGGGLNIPDDLINVVLECGAVAKLQAVDKDQATAAFVAQKRAEYESHVRRNLCRGGDGTKTAIAELSGTRFRLGD